MYRDGFDFWGISHVKVRLNSEPLFHFNKIIIIMLKSMTPNVHQLDNLESFLYKKEKNENRFIRRKCQKVAL